MSDSTFWKYVGVLGVFASFTILSFYSVVGGWSIAYTYEALIGTFNTTAFDNPSAAGKFFDLKNSSASWVLGYHTLFLSLVVIILLSGVRAGLEKASKFLMPVLIFILLILVIQGLILPDANKGVSFLFQPDWSKINGQTILLALGHAFLLSVWEWEQ